MTPEKDQNISRRALFATAGAFMAIGEAAAQTPEPRVKGPAVWLGMDQKELDDAYDQAKYAPNRSEVLKRWATNSDAVRARIGAPKRLAYGPAQAEGLDLYAAGAANAPVQVFLPGGAWRGRFTAESGFPAEMFRQAGAHYLVADYSTVIETKGDLTVLADQVRRAIAWVYRNAGSFGGDASRLYVSGHSSGAHLLGVVLTTDWEKDFGLPKDIVKGALCCSGIYDLKPVRLSARSNYVKFTDEAEQALSPQRHIGLLNTPMVVAYGTLETPEFQRQSRDFAAAVRAAGKPVELIAGEGYNHFEIPETLANPHGLLGRAVLAQMKLAAS